jgi:hypothetical protein
VDDLELRAALAREVMGRKVHWLAEASGFWFEVADADRQKYGAVPVFFERDGKVPAYESTYEGMGLVIERMRELGFRYVIHNANLEGRAFAAFGDASMSGIERGRADDQHLPRAVALAARAAVRSTQ